MRAFTMLLIGLVLWTPSVLRAADISTPVPTLEQLLLTNPLKGNPEARRVLAELKATRDPVKTAVFARTLHSVFEKRINLITKGPSTWTLYGDYIDVDATNRDLMMQVLFLCRDLELWTEYGIIADDLDNINADCYPPPVRLFHLQQVADTLTKAGQNKLAQPFKEAIDRRKQTYPEGYDAWLLQYRTDLRKRLGATLSPLVLMAMDPSDDDVVWQSRWQRVIDTIQTGQQKTDACLCASQLLLLEAHYRFPASWISTVTRDNCYQQLSLRKPILSAIVAMWEGENDEYRNELYRLLTPEMITQIGFRCHCRFIRKLNRYGRTEEALSVRQRLEEIAQGIPVDRLPGDVIDLITPQTPPQWRRVWLNAWCAAWVNGQYSEMASTRTTMPGHIAQWLAAICPPAQVKATAQEFGQQWLTNSRYMGKVELRKYALQLAAELLDAGEAPELAKQARDELKALLAGDPRAMLTAAVSDARLAMAKRQWPDVIAGLKPYFIPKPQMLDLTAIDGLFLLEQAYRNLRQDTDADAVQHTIDVSLTASTIPAGKQALYYADLANATKDPALQSTRLDRARTLARQAGLTSMADRLDEQFDMVAAKDADSATQLEALLNLVRRREAQRMELAYDPTIRQRWFANNLTSYKQLLRLSVKLQNVRYAFTLAEYLRGRSLLDELAWRKVEVGAAVPAVLQTKLQALTRERADMLKLLEASQSSAAPFDSTAITQKLAALAQQEAALQAAVREAVPAFRVASDSASIQPEKMWDTLTQPGTRAVLQYTLVDDGVVVIAFHGAKPPQLVFIPITGDALWEQVGRFREQIWTRDPKLDTSAAALYQLLIAPVESFLTDASALWIVADGALQVLPFSALRDGKGRYLAAWLPVAMVPSISLLCTPRATAAARSGVSTPQKAIIVAAPDTGAKSSPGDDARGLYVPIRGMYMPIRGLYLPIRGDDGVDTALTTLASIVLPGARAEGEALGKILPNSLLLTGKNATKARLRQESATARLLHIATHGYADPEQPNRSGVLLAGNDKRPFETLTAQEVYTWRLSAKLVTLSACQTALGKDVAGEGVLGLSRAFLCAGADSVVCTLWPVADASTADFMTTFYEAESAGWPIDIALAEAQRKLLAADTTCHPYYWAGFTVIRGTWKE